MATVRPGGLGVLVVVDAQVGVMKDAWQAEQVVANIGRLVARARAAGVPVVWVQHGDDELPPGSAAWQWVPSLQPAAQEPLVHKRFNSAFEQTTLDAVLAGLDASHITLAGAATNWCIRATAHGALERGYDLSLVHDAHSTETMVLDDGTTLEAAALVSELNVAMTWLSYPGRRNGTVATDAASFAAPVAAG